MEIVIVTVIAFWLGARFRAVFDRMLFREILRDLGVTEQQLRRLAEHKQSLIEQDEPEQPVTRSPRETIQIRVEKLQDQLYAYRIDNGRFLGQGSTPDDLIARIAETYKNTEFNVPKDQGAEFMKNG